MNKFNTILAILFVCILSYFAISPLFISGFYPIHDDTQVARVFEMKESLQDGMFPVRWVSNLGYGYGYPIFNFYAPFAYYVGGGISLLGINPLDATKIMLGLGVMLSGISMYLLAREFWGKFGGIVAAMLYVYAPYHALDIYVRGDIAELWAYGFVPLVFLGFYKLFDALKHISNIDSRSKIKASTSAKASADKQNSKLQFENKKVIWIWIVVSAFSYAGVILSHNLTAMMVTPFVIAAVIILSIAFYKRKQLFAIRYLLYAIFLGVLLSAFYWLPALFEMNYTNVLRQIGGGADFRDHFVCLPQLWESNWGYGGSTPTCADGLSFRIGKLHIVFSFATFVFGIIYFKKHREKYGAILFAVFSLLLSISLMLPISRPLWESIPFMDFFQYPWRFLLMVSFFSAFLSGGCVWYISQINKKNRKVLSYVFVLLVLLSGYILYAKLFTPQYIVFKSSDEYTNTETLRFATSRISDEYLAMQFRKPNNPNEVASEAFVTEEGDVVYLSTSIKTQEKIAEIEASVESKVRVAIVYFPAWKLYVDGKKHSYEETNNGLLVQVPSGRHTLRFVFEQTPIETFSNAISFVGLLLLVVGILYSRKRSI